MPISCSGILPKTNGVFSCESGHPYHFWNSFDRRNMQWGQGTCNDICGPIKCENIWLPGEFLLLIPNILFWHSRPRRLATSVWNVPSFNCLLLTIFLIGYVPASMGMAMSSTSLISVLNAFVGHYVENIGNTTLKYLEIFNSGTRSTCQKNLNSIDAHSCGRNIRRYQLEQCA